MNSLASELQEDAANRLSSSSLRLKREEVKEEDGSGRYVDGADRFRATEPLLRTLFGEHTYCYRLEVEGGSPKTLFKERNFNLNIRIVDQKR